jgi:hypothetical protein
MPAPNDLDRGGIDDKIECQYRVKITGIKTPSSDKTRSGILCTGWKFREKGVSEKYGPGNAGKLPSPIPSKGL